jgi:hypothetical protein
LLSNNNLLTSVVGFGNLLLVDSALEVSNNSSLANCSWLCNLLNKGKITGSVTIQNNIKECINAAVVVEICDTDFDNDGVPNTIDLDDDNDGITDIIEGTIDTDKDGFPNNKDLDADNDGCFDVVEAGFIDANNNGRIGGTPIKVDAFGLVLNNGGYITPLDTNNNSVLDFLEVSTKNPGSDAQLQLCKKSGAIDLFKSLGPNADQGGVWSPKLASNSSIFNPNLDTPGLYTYTQSSATCGDRSASVLVTFPSELSAGFLNKPLVVCKAEGVFNLLDRLEGKPTKGGVWFPELASKSDFFNPNVDVSGNYTYTVKDNLCGTAQATITINVDNAPNAGTNTTLELCEFASAVDLFSVLEGNPAPGGRWFLNDKEVASKFNPSIQNSATYTYRLDNGICGTASADVKVNVIKNNPIENVRLDLKDFRATNTLSVFVDNYTKYLFSLDDVTFQESPIFTNLNPGEKPYL